MSSFDIGIGMDESTLNRAIAALFGRPGLRARLFQGNRSVSPMGIVVEASWAILAPPTLQLAPPSEQQWQQAIDRQGQTPAPVPGAFTLNLPQLRVSLGQPDDSVQQAVIAATVIATAGLRDNDLALDARALIVDLTQASDFDRLIYESFIIPQVLEATDGMFSGREIPDISFRGLQFGPATIAIGQGRMVAVANLASKPAPGPVAAESLPARPFYILLSREALQQAAQIGSAELRGKVIDTSGSERFGIGEAQYTGRIRLDNVSAGPAANLSEIAATIDVSASARAGVSMFGNVGREVEKAADEVGGAFKQAGREIEKAFSSY